MEKIENLTSLNAAWLRTEFSNLSPAQQKEAIARFNQRERNILIASIAHKTFGDMTIRTEKFHKTAHEMQGRIKKMVSKIEIVRENPGIEKQKDRSRSGRVISVAKGIMNRFGRISTKDVLKQLGNLSKGEKGDLGTLFEKTFKRIQEMENTLTYLESKLESYKSGDHALKMTQTQAQPEKELELRETETYLGKVEDRPQLPSKSELKKNIASLRARIEILERDLATHGIHSEEDITPEHYSSTNALNKFYDYDLDDVEIDDLSLEFDDDIDYDIEGQLGGGSQTLEIKDYELEMEDEGLDSSDFSNLETDEDSDISDSDGISSDDLGYDSGDEKGAQRVYSTIATYIPWMAHEADSDREEEEEKLAVRSFEQKLENLHRDVNRLAAIIDPRVDSGLFEEHYIRDEYDV